MSEEVVQKPKSFLKEKIMRFKIVVFIRKNIILFSIITIFILTLLFGMWSISRYDIVDMEGGEIERNILLEIDDYFNENIDSLNYFVFSSIQFQQKIYSEIPRVERIRIEKIVPNKIIMFLQIHEPKYIVDLGSNECNILSSQGYLLEVVSKEGENEDEDGNREIMEDLCINYALENDLVLFSSTDIEISKMEDGKRRLLLMEDINRVVEVVEAFRYEVNNVILTKDVLEINEKEGRVFKFSMTDDIDTQLKKYIIVIGKIRNDLLEFTSLDLRFERPVMKE
jgi:hypothetical protein